MMYILYGSFIFTTLSLAMWAFRKGEYARTEWEMYERTTFKRIISYLYSVKVNCYSLFSPKYRLIRKEFKKDYNEPLSQELIQTIAEKCYVEEIRKEVDSILRHKEWNEYVKYNFDDTLQLSRRQQFYKIRYCIEEIKKVDLQRVVRVMIKDNLMMEEELKLWMNILRTDNAEDEIRNSIDLAILKAQQYEKNAEHNIPDEILTRTINRDATKRF